MNDKLQIKFLKKLILFSEEESAKENLDEHWRNIKDALETVSFYDVLDNNLDYLDVICCKYSQETVFVIRSFLRRLETFDLIYNPIAGFSEEDLKKYCTKSSLKEKALKIIKHYEVRYPQINNVLDIFFDYAFDANNDKEVKEEACDGLRSLALFNISYWNTHKDFNAQFQVISKVDKLIEKGEQERYWQVIISLLQNILANQVMNFYSPNYNQVEFRQTEIPEEKERDEIRHNCLKLLKALYMSVPSSESDLFGKKLQIIDCMIPYKDVHIEDLEKVVNLYGKEIVKFYSSRIGKEEYELLRQMEIQVCDAYRAVSYKKQDNEKKSYADFKKYADLFLNKLNQNDEYVIYKTLWGWDSVFDNSQKYFIENDDDRLRKIENYVDAIDAKSWENWESRISGYLEKEHSMRPQDTQFIKFLQLLSEKKTEIILNSVSQWEPEKLEKETRYIGFIIREALESIYYQQALDLINSWINKELYFVCSSIFNLKTNIDSLEILEKITDHGIQKKQVKVLGSVLESVTAHYNEGYKTPYKNLFFRIIDCLCELKETHWIQNILYRDNFLALIKEVDKSQCNVLLKNFLNSPCISSNVEEILACLTQNHLHAVLNFLRERCEFSEDKNKIHEHNKQHYEAIPYKFYKLDEALSQHPKESLDMLHQYYEKTKKGNSLSFLWRVHDFLRATFNKFPETFKAEILRRIDTKNDETIRFVLALLKEYEDRECIHQMCRNIIKKISIDSDILDLVKNVLAPTTGVFVGEFAQAEAYQEAVELFEYWETEGNTKLSSFVNKYLPWFKQVSQEIRERSEDDLKIRKYEFENE